MDLEEPNARSSSTKKKVKEIKPFVNEEQKTVFYLGNFEENEGRTLLAADRRMTPILAYSDTGEFDPDTDNPGIRIWLSWVESNFKDVQKETEIEPSIGYLWDQYDLASGLGNEKSGRAAMVPCPYGGLPANTLVEHLTDHFSAWRQGPGYNHFSPAGIFSPFCTFDCDKAPAGCGPVAAAQVLRYHAREVTIDGTTYTPAMFGNMPRQVSANCNLTDPNSLNVAQLIRGAGKGLSAVYNTMIFGTGVSVTGCQTWNIPGHIDNFFSGLGFTSYDRDFSSNISLLKLQLSNNHPVIVYGSSCDVCFSNMHIWIIDGIKTTWNWLPLPPNQCTEEPEVRRSFSGARTADEQCCYMNSYTYYQMNWGWGEVHNNGWFSIPISNDGTTYNNAGMKMYIVN